PSYAVELRDAGWFQGETRTWLERELTERRMALGWSSLTYVEVPPLRTADWIYLRFIGDHATIPAETHGEIRVDRSKEIRHWAEQVRRSEARSVFSFFNNHFAGFAPISARIFAEEMGLPGAKLPGGPGAGGRPRQGLLD
ncbi:MAG: DUF72 domain-containing protein, partial [Thermoplasmata archaeon]